MDFHDRRTGEVSDVTQPEPALRAGQMWHTSEGKVAIVKDPEPAMNGQWNVLHVGEDHPEAPGWMYTHHKTGKWSIGPDREEVHFHELLHDPQRRDHG